LSGSIAGKGCPVFIPESDKKSVQEIERSLTKRFRKDIWSKFIKGIKTFELIEEGDKIAVAISGGKDSLIMAKLFQELKKHKVMNFELVFLTMDPGYHPDIRELHDENCKTLDLPVQVFESKLFDVVGDIAGDMPCYMCAKMRRGFLYSKAQELGCNKLALGHHYDDVIETNMLNILYAGCFKTMMPKIKSSNFENMELIRPMTYIREKDIIKWADYSGIMPLNCACMVAAKKTSGKRYEIKDLIQTLKETNPNVENSIFKSAMNVELGAIMGYKKDGVKHSFLDNWSDKDK